MKCLSYLEVLHHPPNMLNVVHKLPSYLQNKWREHVSQTRQTQQRVLQFGDLVTFVASASDAANDPIYGKGTLRQYKRFQLKKASFPRTLNFKNQ